MQVTPSRSGIPPGTVIAGRYRLGGLIGYGGMADVYDGVDQRLERSVAVKLLRSEMVVRDDVRSRFEAEARSAAGLSHPNAVAVFDTGEHEGVPFLVMERLPGDTLADRIASGPVDPAWLRQAAAGVLGALAAAHTAGIVHRDVKPGNILIAADGTAKIADFGIAKSLPSADGSGDGPADAHADLTGTGQVLGTPAYLAPERLEGRPATPRSDLWAFGVVLYEALAGRKPFDGATPLGVARAVAEGEHVPLGTVRPDLDPRLVATVERAMARDPADRFASAGEMAGALDAPALGTPHPDATVDERPDGTLVLPTMERAAMERAVVERAAVPRRSRRPSSSWRRPWLVWALLGGAIVVGLLLLARSGGQSIDAVGQRATATTVASAPVTTAAPAASHPLSQRLREAAGRLDPSRDGSRANDLAAGLRQVAADLDSGSPATAGHATGMIVSAAAWNQTGQLTNAATVTAVQLLQEVPGVQAAVGPATPTPTTAAPASNGKGKAKKD